MCTFHLDILIILHCFSELDVYLLFLPIVSGLRLSFEVKVRARGARFVVVMMMVRGHVCVLSHVNPHPILLLKTWIRRCCLPPRPPPSSAIIWAFLIVHPDVCSILVKTLKQTFCSPISETTLDKPVLPPTNSTSIQLPCVGPSNCVFFSTHSSYRLDKINSDMRNYITNFAADLRWIQHQGSSSLSLVLLNCSSQKVGLAGWLPCWHTQYGCLIEQTLKTSQWKVSWVSLLILHSRSSCYT